MFCHSGWHFARWLPTYMIDRSCTFPCNFMYLWYPSDNERAYRDTKILQVLNRTSSRRLQASFGANIGKVSVDGTAHKKEETTFSTYPEKKAAGTITRRGPALKGFLCPIAVAQSPINAFRTVKRPDGALKSGLKRAPFAIAFYNVYRRGCMYLRTYIRMYIHTYCVLLAFDADTLARLYSYSLHPFLVTFNPLKRGNVQHNFEQCGSKNCVSLGLILINAVKI